MHLLLQQLVSWFHSSAQRFQALKIKLPLQYTHIILSGMSNESCWAPACFKLTCDCSGASSSVHGRFLHLTKELKLWPIGDAVNLFQEKKIQPIEKHRIYKVESVKQSVGTVTTLSRHIGFCVTWDFSKIRERRHTRHYCECERSICSTGDVQSVSKDNRRNQKENESAPCVL